MHVFVLYFLLIAFSILVYMLFSYSAFRLQECSIKSVSQSTDIITARPSSSCLGFGRRCRSTRENYLGGSWSDVAKPFTQRAYTAIASDDETTDVVGLRGCSSVSVRSDCVRSSCYGPVLSSRRRNAIFGSAAERLEDPAHSLSRTRLAPSFQRPATILSPCAYVVREASKNRISSSGAEH